MWLGSIAPAILCPEQSWSVFKCAVILSLLVDEISLKYKFSFFHSRNLHRTLNHVEINGIRAHMDKTLSQFSSSADNGNKISLLCGRQVDSSVNECGLAARKQGPVS